MELIHRKHAKGHKTYEIYTKAEADKKGIEYVEWQEAEPGMYGITTDGYVSICLNKNTYISNRDKVERSLFTYPFGRKWNQRGKKGVFEYVAYRDGGCYNAASPQSWVDMEARRFRTLVAVRTYARMMFEHGAAHIDWVKLGKIYRPDEKMPAAKVKKLFKQERIQKMASDELKRIMDSEGVTTGMAVAAIREAIEIARGKNDANAMLKAADQILELRGEKAGKKVVTESLEASQSIAGMIEAAEEKMKLSRKTETIED